jgi:exosortase/archaeosortase family protein
MAYKKRKLNFKEFKKDLKNKKEYIKALYFLIYFIIFFFIIYNFLNISFIYKYINLFYGKISYLILSNTFLLNSSFYFIDNISLIVSSNFSLAITKLCTAILEFSLISAAILSSRGIPWLKRIKGVLYSIFVIIIFNILRIIITCLVINYLSLDLATFLHSFLFRLFIIIVVGGFYFIWLKVNFK